MHLILFAVLIGLISLMPINVPYNLIGVSIGFAVCLSMQVILLYWSNQYNNSSGIFQYLENKFNLNKTLMIEILVINHICYTMTWISFLIFMIEFML